MSVFYLYLSRTLKDRTGLILVLMLPVTAFGIVLMGMAESSDIHVGVVDLDQTVFSQMLVDALDDGEGVRVLYLDNVHFALVRGAIDFGITIPSGYTEQLLNQEKPKIQTLSVEGANRSIPIKLRLERLLQEAYALAQEDETQYYQDLSKAWKQKFTVRNNEIETKGLLASSVLGFGFLMFSMLLMSAGAAVKIQDDKEKLLMQRVLVAPITLKSYMFQSMLAFLTVTILQVVGFLVMMHLGLDLGQSSWLIAVVLVLFGVIVVAFAMALANMTKNAEEVGVISTLLIIPMTLLGGAFWPRWVMPELLQELGKFVPTTWALEAINQVLDGATLMDVHVEIMILIMFALVFLLLGSWKKADI